MPQQNSQDVPLPPTTTTSKTIQPLYLAQANVFTFNSLSSNSSWTPLRPHEVPISILYDENRAIYRIISMDLQNSAKKVLVNSTLLPFLEFHKTSATFGHWTDKSTGKIYGIGFQSQFELDAFEDSLKKAQSGILTRKTSVMEQSSSNNPDCIYPSGTTYKNWSQLLHQVKKTHAKVPMILIPPSESLPQTQRDFSSTATFTIPNASTTTTSTTPKIPSQHNSDTLTSLLKENDHLRSVSIESCTNAKKWELQIDTVSSENDMLHARITEASHELEELTKQEFEFKSALIKWQECVRKSGNLEQKVKRLEEEVAQLGQLAADRSKVTSEDLMKVETYYKNALEATRKNIETVMGANSEGKSIFTRIDYLFAKVVKEMIVIHEKIVGGCGD